MTSHPANTPPHGITLVGCEEGIRRIGWILRAADVTVARVYAPGGCDLSETVAWLCDAGRTPVWVRHPSALGPRQATVVACLGSPAENIRLAEKVGKELATFAAGSAPLLLGEPAVPLLHCLSAGGTLPLYPFAPGAGVRQRRFERTIAGRLGVPEDQVAIPLLGGSGGDTFYVPRYARVAAIPLLELLPREEVEKEASALPLHDPPDLSDCYLVDVCRAMLSHRSSVLTCLAYAARSPHSASDIASLPFLVSAGTPPVPWIDPSAHEIASRIALAVERHNAVLRSYGM